MAMESEAALHLYQRVKFGEVDTMNGVTIARLACFIKYRVSRSSCFTEGVNEEAHGFGFFADGAESAVISGIFLSRARRRTFERSWCRRRFERQAWLACRRDHGAMPCVDRADRERRLEGADAACVALRCRHFSVECSLVA